MYKLNQQTAPLPRPETWRARRKNQSTDLKDQGPRRRKTHSVALPTGPEFRPGDVVRETGIYEVIHNSEHRTAHEVVMVASHSFPPCENCGTRVRFRLVRTAPYIFSDEDFEPTH